MRILVLITLLSMIVPTPNLLANSFNTDDNAKQQKIKLLSNRFRIDEAVDSLIFIIERKPGSGPVILVQPDGSKLYSTDRIKGLNWVDANTGDMIKIEQPMIGPWQIIGDILPSSEIRLASALALNVTSFPQEVFVGEKLKLTANIHYDNKLLELAQVDDLLKLSVYLRSTTDETSPNFGAGTFIIGEYIDNGEQLDEQQGDGVFTGVLDLDKPIGPYTLFVRARNKVFEREYVQYIYLRPPPIKVDVISAAIDGYYTLRLTSNTKAIDISKTAVQVTIRSMTAEKENLGIRQLAPTHFLRLTNVVKQGRYKIDMEVFGTTPTGREFSYRMKQMAIKIEAPAASEIQAQKIVADNARQAQFERDQLEKDTKQAQQHAADETKRVVVIVMVNILIALVGGILMWIFLRKKTPPEDKSIDSKTKKKS